MEIRKLVRLAFMAFLPLAFSCSDLPEAPDQTVPEFSSVTYTVSADSVRLRAELNRKPIGEFSCGFMLGTDTTDMQTVHSEIMDSPAFESTICKLKDSTTYFLIAFISNGRNDIFSELKNFSILKPDQESEEPEDPEDPEEPEGPETPGSGDTPGAENPGNPDTPINPDTPENPLPDVPEEPETPADPNFIRFTDKIIEEQCIAAFDADNDGALSYEEAASVMDLSHMKITNRMFTSFNELKYFTSLTIIPEKYFRSCTRLSSITLPESITCISEEAFKNCTSLSRINIPKDLKNILRLAFEGCRSLTRVDLSSLETFLSLDYGNDEPTQSHPLKNGASLYLSGSKLTDIVIPESITEIKDFALMGCKNLQSVSLHGGIKNVGKQAFDSCSALEKVHFHDNISSFDICIFWECTSLKEIVLPKAMYEIPEAMFARCSSLEEVTIQENVTMIGYNSFEGCYGLRKVTLTGKYPPAISPNTFSSNITFHVPEDAVEAYRTAPDWSIHADRIVGF